VSADVKEAARREESFIGNLADAQDDYEWIVQHEAWLTLGYDSFADWWSDRVTPIMRALSMRPTREIAASVVEQVRAEEAALPPAQRRREGELAQLVGATADEIRNRSPRSTSTGIPTRVDLERPQPPVDPLPAPIAAAINEAIAEHEAERAERRQHRAEVDALNAELGYVPDPAAEAERDRRTALLYPFFNAVKTIAAMPAAEEIPNLIEPYQQFRLDELPAATAWLSHFNEVWKEQQ
jgi:hypothetical protein